MGWSIDLVIGEINTILRNNPHEVVMPEANESRYVRINYSREIAITTKRRICDLFPRDYYVFFHPGTIKEDPKEIKVRVPGHVMNEANGVND